MELTRLLNSIVNLQLHMYNVHVHVLMVLTILLNQFTITCVHFYISNLVVIIILNSIMNLQVMNSQSIVQLYVHVLSEFPDYLIIMMYITVYNRSCKLTNMASRILKHFEANLFRLNAVNDKTTQIKSSLV